MHYHQNPDAALCLCIQHLYQVQATRRMYTVSTDIWIPSSGHKRAVHGAGHGYDNNQCAEFCITSHHFTVNGKEHVLNFTEAGKPWGCADKVRI